MSEVVLEWDKSLEFISVLSLDDLFKKPYLKDRLKDALSEKDNISKNWELLQNLVKKLKAFDDFLAGNHLSLVKTFVKKWAAAQNLLGSDDASSVEIFENRLRNSVDAMIDIVNEHLSVRGKSLVKVELKLIFAF